MKAREFTKRMKAELNNEKNLFNELEMKLYGVQAYFVVPGEEYSVIIKATRAANGRYYFVTREGYRVAWSTLPADKVESICKDMYDRHAADEAAVIKSVNQLRNTGNALVPAEIIDEVADTAEAVGVRCFVLTSGTDETNRIKYLCSIAPTAEEGRELAKAAQQNREAEDTTTPTPSESKSESESEAKPARRFAAVVADYIAGTWFYTIKPAAAKFGRKAAHVITRAALFAFRFVWFAAIFCASVGTMLATGYGLSFTPLQYAPILLRILLFTVCIFSATAGIEGLLLYISKKIDNATNNRLFAMH